MSQNFPFRKKGKSYSHTTSQRRLTVDSSVRTLRDVDGDALWFQNIALSWWENQNLIKISKFREQKLVFDFFALNGL